MQPHTILYYNPHSTNYPWFAHRLSDDLVSYHCSTPDNALRSSNIKHSLAADSYMLRAIIESDPYPIYTTLEQDYPELFI